MPAIAKADSLTQAELAALRADVAEAIEVEGIPVVDLAGEVRAARAAAAAGRFGYSGDSGGGGEGSNAVLALVGGTVFEGGRAARVYPWVGLALLAASFCSQNTN